MRVAQRGVVALLDFIVNFLAVHGDFEGGIDADFDRAAFQAQHRDLNPPVNDDVLAWFSRKDKHR